ncbi:uncharacterized protein LOC118738288 [Rhagoletis pomonella]|uniref:uncharacterized protein LOC118738288 n=1 Tax=Rhagoletis pomonella TaxID=28610 RepID=UPI00177B8C8C|nr:uncharacterized protein LOC118738288 [Rhagoletis pomonella]
MSGITGWAYHAPGNSINAYDVLVEGIGAFSCTRTKGVVQITIESTHSDFAMAIEALVITSITSVIPAAQIDVKRYKHLAGLHMADPNLGIPGVIDLLLGADFWGLILEGDIIRGGQNEPHAQLTRLQSYRAQILEDSRLDAILSNFWKLEDEPAGTETVDDESELIFSKTHTRTPEGRYMVRLPIRGDASELGDSYYNAVRQFHHLERRLTVDKDMRDKYIEFMREYIELGHMEPVDNPGDHSRTYYIPHHAVTEKFRVVFNASARTSNGVTLNEIQLVGPSLQDPLINIILRFRRYPVALTADVEKMFRQVLVAPKDRDLQRILWREAPAEDIRVYRLKNVTYGMACSPYNAVRSLNQCAIDKYNRVSDHNQAITARNTILSSFYLDDFLTSCADTQEAITLANAVDTILSSGCFKLRKWNSNRSMVLQHFMDSPLPAERDIDAPIATVLGLRWDPVTDDLLFKVAFNNAYLKLQERRGNRGSTLRQRNEATQ